MDINDISLVGTGENTQSQLRFAQIRQYVSSLSHNEIRYLRQLLPEPKIDIIGELPTELVIQITEWLDLPDYLVCLIVSTRWQETFSSDPILNIFIDRFCPSLTHRPGLIQTTQVEKLERLRRMGVAIARRFSRNADFKHSFQWESESYFKLDPEYHKSHDDILGTYAQFDPDGGNRGKLKCLYSHGKIAWRYNNHIVVIDSFWSRTRKIFNVPTGSLTSPKLKLLEMGNQVLVGYMGHLLVAWDHVRNIYQEKRLPGPIRCATVEGPKVAVILYNGDAFIWEFGGILKALVTAPLVKHHGLSTGTDALKQWQSSLTAIFHPTCSGTLFLASAYIDSIDTDPDNSSIKRGALQHAVYEFNGTQHVKTFEIETIIQLPSIGTYDSVIIGKTLPYHRDGIGFYKWSCIIFDIYDRKFTPLNDPRFDDWLFDHLTDLEFRFSFYEDDTGGYNYSVFSLQPGGFDFGTT